MGKEEKGPKFTMDGEGFNFPLLVQLMRRTLLLFWPLAINACIIYKIQFEHQPQTTAFVGPSLICSKNLTFLIGHTHGNLALSLLSAMSCCLHN